MNERTQVYQSGGMKVSEEDKQSAKGIDHFQGQDRNRSERQRSSADLAKMLQHHTNLVKNQEVAPTVHFERVKRRDRLIPAQLPIHLRLVWQKAYFLPL